MHRSVLKELKEKGFADVSNPITLFGLNHICRSLHLQPSELGISVGPAEMIRISMPTEPKRNVPMGSASIARLHKA